MNSYLNPKVFALPNPVGLDIHIAKLQAKLAALPWLQKVFGRAIQQRATVDKREVVFPEVWAKNREPENIMPNDNLRAYCFFIARDTATFINAEPGDQQVYLRQPMSCIMWSNLAKIDPTRKYRFTEELKRDMLSVFAASREVTLGSLSEQYDQVFSPFTITDTYRQFLKPPFYALRTNFDLTYPELAENCAAAYPPGVLLSEMGLPLLNEDGSYLYADDDAGSPLLAEDGQQLLSENDQVLLSE